VTDFGVDLRNNNYFDHYFYFFAIYANLYQTTIETGCRVYRNTYLLSWIRSNGQQ